MPILAALSSIGTLAFLGMGAFDVIKGLMQKDGEKTKYTQTAEAVAAETDLSPDEVKKLSAMTMYSKIEEDGGNPDSFWSSLSEEARAEIQWSPEQLRRIEDLANFSAITTGFAWATAALAGGATAVGGIILSGKTLKAIGEAKLAGTIEKELPLILASAKFRGIKTLAVPALVTAVAGMAAWLTPQINNQLQDPGQWGRIMLEQLQQKRDAAAGKTTSGGYAQTPKTRVAEYKTAKPKLFTGIIYNGQVGKFDQFVRSVDDEITDDADLKADVEINLLRYISKIPNNLSYSIQIKNSPTDELGIPRSGTWCTLSIYLTNQFHKRVFIDEILLGPVDPFVYYPESQKVESLQYEIPKLVKFDTVHPMDTYRGQERIVSTTGDIITDVLRDGTKAVAGASVTTPTIPTATTVSAGTEKAIPNSVSAEGASMHDQPPLFGTLYRKRGSEALAFSPWPELYTPEEQAKLSQDPGKFAGNEQKLKDRGVNTSQVRQYRFFDLEPWFGLPQRAVGFAEFFGVSAPTAGFPKQVHVLAAKLNVRSQPTSQSATAGSIQLVKGDVFTAVALVEGETVSGNNKWWKSSLGNFVWSGGTD